jgi:hypothetical protein
MSNKSGSVMIHVAEVMGFCGAGGLILAQVPSVDISKLDTWPVQALLALTSLASLGITFFVVRNLFTAIKDMGRAADATQELCARLNVRPCLMDEKK